MACSGLPAACCGLTVRRAQEKSRLFRAVKRRDADEVSYPWIVPATGLVNQWYSASDRRAVR
jgi:hypothetical protein